MTDSKDAPNLAHPRYWGTWAMAGLTWLVAQLPLPLLHRAGRGLGRLFWLLARSRRDTALTNIRLCFPELDATAQRQLARQSVISVGEAFGEIAAGYFNKRLRLQERLEVSGLEHLRAAQASGKGIILLGMHFNTLDIAGRLVALLTPVGAVYRPNDNPVLDQMIAKGRRSYCDEYIDRSDLRALVRSLRAGKVVWYAPDQDYGTANAVFAPFFDHPAATITATARLARMGKAIVIPLAHYREQGSRYRVVFGEPLADFPSGDDVSDATRVNDIIERYVRLAPEQYLWVHRRFKHQPAGRQSPYRKKRR